MSGAHYETDRGFDGTLGRSPTAVLLLALLFAANSSLGTVFYFISRSEISDVFRIIDFPSFYMAADSVFNRGLSPYADTTRQMYEHLLGFRVYEFLYPPYALPVLYPLSRLDYLTGASALLALNTVAAFVLFRQLHHMFLSVIRNANAYWAALFLLFICSAVRETVFVGQLNMIAILSLLWAWQLLRSGDQPVLAGALIGLAIISKTYFALLLLLFVLRLDWRPVLGACATVLGFAVVSMVLLGEEPTVPLVLALVLILLGVIVGMSRGADPAR